jgi:hypothetical protein
MKERNEQEAGGKQVLLAACFLLVFFLAYPSTGRRRRNVP